MIVKVYGRKPITLSVEYFYKCKVDNYCIGDAGFFQVLYKLDDPLRRWRKSQVFKECAFKYVDTE